MAKIRNDPTRYVKRSDIASHKSGRSERQVIQISVERERAFMTAPIDERFYIDFRESARRKKKRTG